MIGRAGMWDKPRTVLTGSKTRRASDDGESTAMTLRPIVYSKVGVSWTRVSQGPATSSSMSCMSKAAERRLEAPPSGEGRLQEEKTAVF